MFSFPRQLTEIGQQSLASYEVYLRTQLDLSAATIRNYLDDLALFATWCEDTWSAGVEESAPFTAANLVTPTIIQYRGYLQHDRKLKPSTINRRLISIRRFLDWALDSDQIQRNPITPIKPIPQVQLPARHLNDREEAALLRAIDEVNSPRDRALVTLMLQAGLRVGEVRLLERAQVVLGKNTGSVAVIGKRNKHRQVPLNATARAVLREYLPLITGDTPYLFPSEKTGKALGERMVQTIVSRYAERAKIPALSPHDLRHRFGYRLAEANVPIHRIAQLMGHDSYNTTLIYIKGTAADLQKAVEQLVYE